MSCCLQYDSKCREVKKIEKNISCPHFLARLQLEAQKFLGLIQNYQCSHASIRPIRVTVL